MRTRCDASSVCNCLCLKIPCNKALPLGPQPGFTQALKLLPQTECIPLPSNGQCVWSSQFCRPFDQAVMIKGTCAQAILKLLKQPSASFFAPLNQRLSPT